MNHVPFTILAYLLNSAALLVDKFMITKTFPSPLTYVFYFSTFSLMALILIPFISFPGIGIFTLGSLASLLWIGGLFAMLSALKISQASRVIPIIGSIVPSLLLFYDASQARVSDTEVAIVLILIAGLILLISPDLLSEKVKNLGKFISFELPLEVIAALLFSCSYLILRAAYIQSDFLTVFAWSRLVLIPLGILLIALPYTRRTIFAHKINPLSFNLSSKVGLIFLGGQIAGGLSELLINFSISLATPSLVNSLQGVQYAFLFLASLSLSQKYPHIFKEKVDNLSLFTKICGLILIFLGLYLLAFARM